MESNSEPAPERKGSQHCRRMGYHPIIPPFVGERAAWDILHLLVSGWGQGHTPQMKWWQHGWGCQGRWEPCSNAQTVLHNYWQEWCNVWYLLVEKRWQSKEHRRHGCMRDKRSVSQQIVWLNERQHVLGLVWSSAHAAWPARMWALTVHLGSHLESQHSDSATEFASREEAALIVSLFSTQAPIFTKLLEKLISKISITLLNLAECCQQFPKLLLRNCYTVQLCEMTSLESWDNKSWWLRSEPQKANPTDLKKMGSDKLTYLSYHFNLPVVPSRHFHICSSLYPEVGPSH